MSTEGTALSIIAERVALGEAFMDEHDAEWWREDAERAIDLDMLDMGRGDWCVLGQRCPLEVLAEWLGSASIGNSDWEYGYNAYAQVLARGQHDISQWRDRDGWAIAHGFNAPLGADDGEYCTLTAEWARVIRMRRRAAA